jgi:hypothetical protein
MLTPNFASRGFVRCFPFFPSRFLIDLNLTLIPGTPPTEMRRTNPDPNPNFISYLSHPDTWTLSPLPNPHPHPTRNLFFLSVTTALPRVIFHLPTSAMRLTLILCGGARFSAGGIPRNQTTAGTSRKGGLHATPRRFASPQPHHHSRLVSVLPLVQRPVSKLAATRRLTHISHGSRRLLLLFDPIRVGVAVVFTAMVQAVLLLGCQDVTTSITLIQLEGVTTLAAGNRGRAERVGEADSLGGGTRDRAR